MFNLKYEEIIEKIKKEKNIPEEEIQQKIKDKLNQLSDLISKEGAAHIVANELGVKVFQNIQQRKLQIKDVIAGLNSVNLVGKVTNIFEPRSYKTEKHEGKVANFIIGDETGTMRIVMWDNSLIREIENGNLKEGDIVKIQNAYSRDNNGNKELHMGQKSQLTINPEGEKIESVKFNRQLLRKNISDLKENDFAEIIGTIVQVFEPKFYAACPECNKKLDPKEDKFYCNQHGLVPAIYTPIINIFFDDGTENIRIVFFRDLVAKLLGLTKEQVSAFRENPASFEEIKTQVQGKQLKISGKVNKNEMFQRLEFTASDIEELDPMQIADELVAESEKNDV